MYPIPPPRLLEENLYGYNIIEYNQKFYALKQDIGEICLDKIADEHLNTLVANKICYVTDDLRLTKINILEHQKGLRPKLEKTLLKTSASMHRIWKGAPRSLLRLLNHLLFKLSLLPMHLLNKKLIHITILLPSRGRAKRCKDMIQDFLKKAKNPYGIEFLVLVDQDDTDDYESTLHNFTRKYFVRITRSTPTAISGERYNQLAALARGEILMYAADDIVMHTLNWDELIWQYYNLFPDKILLCSDGGSEIPLHGFISKVSYNLLGYIFPPYFRYGYNDIWLYDIYQKINRHLILKELKIEHRHWHTYPELFDATYAKVLSSNKEKNIAEELDKKVYDAKQNEILKEINKLKLGIETYKTSASKKISISKEIYYPINLLKSHYKITASHPLFKDFINHISQGWSFSQRFTKANFFTEIKTKNAYLRQFIRQASAFGAKREDIKKFISTRCIQLCSSDKPKRLFMMPTYPQYFGPESWFIEVEDWTTLFDPFLLNGQTENIDIKKHSMFPVVKSLFMQPNFRGAITHMKSTQLALEALFPELIGNKIFYVPPAYGKPRKSITYNESIPIFTFLNSYSAGHRNFILRGGGEVLSAFNNLDKQGVNFKLVIRAKLDTNQLTSEQQSFLSNKKVIWIKENLSDEQITQLIVNSYAFLLPAYRIHVIATLQALNAGVPIICSDGWGYNEFIEHQQNGWIVKGFKHKAYNDSENILRENYDADPNESTEITTNIEIAVKTLIANPDLRNTLAQNALLTAQQKFSQEQRKNYLTNTLEKLIL